MRAPWHIWIVGVLSFLWNAGGAYDYLMTQTGNATYMAMFTEEQRAMLALRPLWFDVAWATGIWFAVAGSVLLLLRSRFATAAFGLSFAGLVAATVWTYGIATPSAFEVMGPSATIFSAAIALSIVLLWIYSRAMTRRGVLH